MAKPNQDSVERGSEFANRGQVSETDSVALESGLGRAPSEADTAPAGSVQSEEIREKSVGSRPVSDRTDVRTSGSGAAETDDGLDDTAESVREGAEDTIERESFESDDDEPVFDRGEDI